MTFPNYKTTGKFFFKKIVPNDWDDLGSGWLTEDKIIPIHSCGADERIGFGAYPLKQFGFFFFCPNCMIVTATKTRSAKKTIKHSFFAKIWQKITKIGPIDQLKNT